MEECMERSIYFRCVSIEGAEEMGHRSALSFMESEQYLESIVLVPCTILPVQ